jgi:cytochrome P450
MTGPELTTALLPGQQLHELLAAARSAPGLTPARLLGQPALLVTRYADLKAFMVDETSFPGGPVYQFSVEPVCGPTFISMDGEEHVAVRQQAMPAFRSRPVSRFIDDQLLPLAHEVVDRFALRGRPTWSPSSPPYSPTGPSAASSGCRWGVRRSSGR